MQGAADVLGRDEQGKEVVAIVEGLLKSCRSPPKLQELSQAPHPVIVLEGLDGVGKVKRYMACSHAPVGSLKTLDHEYITAILRHNQTAVEIVFTWPFRPTL